MKTASSLADLLLNHARQQPAHCALIWEDRHWSRAELLADTSALADVLVDSRLAPGTPLAIAGNALSLLRHSVAAARAGLAIWPVERLNPGPAFTVTPGTALLIATSGSEGEPRVVQHSARSLVAAATAGNVVLPLGPDDLWLNCLPLYHIGGQAILWRCALAGATVLLHDGFNLDRLGADLNRYPVSHLSLVPTMLARLLDAGIRPPSSLRHVLIGGAALPPTLHAAATSAGWPLRPSYGMSETAAMIACWTPDCPPWQAGAVGRALPGNEIRIDGSGRIAVRSAQLMTGYANAPRLPSGHWFTTSDLGHLDADGQLTVLGRADDMLISGGYNIHPLRIEACLAAMPGITDVAVTGIPDPVWGDRIVALIVGSVSEAAVLAHARRHLPSPALPRTMRFLDRLPRTHTGKLQRDILQRLARSGSDQP